MLTIDDYYGFVMAGVLISVLSIIWMIHRPMKSPSRTLTERVGQIFTLTIGLILTVSSISAAIRFLGLHPEITKAIAADHHVLPIPPWIFF